MTEKQTPHVCVVGLWHLGVVYSACLAELGYDVVGVDRDNGKIENLNKGIPPLFEPELANIMAKNIERKKLLFTSDLKKAVKASDFVIIGFDTRVDDNDEVDLSDIYAAVQESIPFIEVGTVIIVSSQVPLGTCEQLKLFIAKERPGLDFDVACVPENLRLGQAIERFFNPERIIIGANNDATLNRVELFFGVIQGQKLRMNLRSAEMCKHALNAYLATSISFANEIANVCDEVGVDALIVAEALLLDSRIGRKAMLKPGLGFAGGTLARDIRALQKIGEKTGYTTRLINAVFEVNVSQNKLAVTKLHKLYGSIKKLRVGVFGLTYKPGTSTLRRSASIEIIKHLTSEGAIVSVYDPKADLNELHENASFDFFTDPIEAARRTDALVFVTAWPDFKTLDFLEIKSVMNKPVIIDAQNMLNAPTLEKMGFTYLGVGRGQH